MGESIYPALLEARLEGARVVLARLEETFPHLGLRNAESEGGVPVEQQTLCHTQIKLFRQMISSIEAAFLRLQEGKFGICIQCKEKIPEERLLAIPETPWCVECASIMKNAGGGNSRKRK